MDLEKWERRERIGFYPYGKSWRRVFAWMTSDPVRHVRWDVATLS